MRRAVVVSSALLVLACGPTARQAEAPAPPPPPPPTMADFAGTWRSVSVMEGAPDTILAEFSGPASEYGWQLTLPGRPPMPMQAWVQGDSLIAVSPKYESILRKGVQVQLRSSGVLRDGRLVGRLLATYDSAGGQALGRGTFEAERVE